MPKARLTKEEKEYQNKIMRDYDLSMMACAVMKCKSKSSYKELLKKLQYESSVIIEMQNTYYDLEPTKIREFFNHSKNKLVLAHAFLRTLYGLDPNKRINQMFMKKAFKFKNWYENVYLKEELKDDETKI